MVKAVRQASSWASARRRGGPPSSFWFSVIGNPCAASRENLDSPVLGRQATLAPGTGVSLMTACTTLARFSSRLRSTFANFVRASVPISMWSPIVP